MNKENIRNTLKFMERVELKGAEVPAFVECINTLTTLLKEEEDVGIIGEEPK